MCVLNCLVECSAHDRHKHVYEDDISEKCGEHKMGEHECGETNVEQHKL